MLEVLFERGRAAFSRALAAALSAALAYWLAHLLFGQPQPIFAAISALICLAPGIANHLRQGASLLLGVTIGILVGEVAFLIPYDMGEIRLACATFLAMMIASLFGLAAVVPIQAGASAMLVLLLGPQTAGLVRFLDVIVGVAIGVVVAVVFFRSKPAS
ncbi:FUSC family protein [Sinorhizobium sp. BG8]|uniref:FUSC family protein n=1 Tax=Sinorhizobium sp. BG8 TaxID=2613773 RepID=UPI00193E620F|nr:FUSC family protein [Sinorhizobium sp. BG8]QRM54933.1 aromatic acid exporter family protein [Sinorhizobium sp. BG8]